MIFHVTVEMVERANQKVIDARNAGDPDAPFFIAFGKKIYPNVPLEDAALSLCRGKGMGAKRPLSSAPKAFTP